MKIKKIHFVGIKGVGQTALSVVAKEAGIEVTGSDIEEEFITDKVLSDSGIMPYVGFSENNLGDPDLVITTGAHGGFDNIEVRTAQNKGIKVITKGEAVGLFMNGEIFGKKFEGISVAGSHGKTTLTALIATIFREAKLDPSFVVGTGEIPSLSSSGHYGKGKYFIAEADEYATEPKYDKTPQFLWQFPKIAVFTNIELDHPDIYSNVERVREAFLKFAENLRNGVLVVCGDDPQIRQLLKEYKGRSITYGFSLANDFVLERVKTSGYKTFFWAKTKDLSLGEFTLEIPGEHNALNALGAIVVALEAGLALDTIKSALLTFVGTKRRFEYLGKLRSGALAYDDYAHHPTEIVSTLKTFKESFPGYKIICIFQPHTYSRTKELFEQFSSSFSHADKVIISDIFPSLREASDPSISSKLLTESISKNHTDALFLPKLQDVIEYLDQNDFDDKTVVISMGAGDIYKIWKNLL